MDYLDVSPQVELQLRTAIALQDMFDSYDWLEFYWWSLRVVHMEKVGRSLREVGYEVT